MDGINQQATATVARPVVAAADVNWRALTDCGTVVLFVSLLYYFVTRMLKFRYPSGSQQGKAVMAGDAKRLLALKKELAAISAVAEFAKHARKKRQVDALSAEMKQRENAPNRVKVRVYSTILRYILFAFTMFCLSVVYYGVPVLFVDAGLFSPFNRLLAFPGCSSIATNNSDDGGGTGGGKVLTDKVPVSMHCLLMVSTTALKALIERWTATESN